MDCHPPSRRQRKIILSPLLLLALTSSAGAADQPSPIPTQATTPLPAPQLTPITRAFRNDAALHAIAFADASAGWAVGDRGVIWHTTDGGASWRQQTSPVSCTLNAVCFIDARRGWAAGGLCQPYSNATRGIILRTEDGGATWRQLPQPLLPLLTGVKFFDRDHGIAFGQSASYYPSGVFATNDGGATWMPLPSEQPGEWLAGDFIAPDAGSIAGPAGQIATLVRRKVVTSPLAAASLRSVRAMQLVAPTGGWAVGDGGLLLTTADLGRSWQTPPTNPTSGSQFDLHAVAVQGPHIWIAGTPGTLIFHSPDNGNTWQQTATGQTAPIRALQFIDAQHGWAAGDFGNIHATHDGGQSWQAQRSGAQRAALLAIFANPADVPLELLATYGAADSYIAAADILCTTPAGEVAAATGQRPREALLLAGAAATNTAWRFPLPPAELALSPEDLLAALNRENDGRAIQQLQDHLVRELRMWRPDVVVLQNAPTESGATPIAALINRLVMQSVAAAADSKQRNDAATAVGLAPWQVKKVYGLNPPGVRGEDFIDTTNFSPWLGATLSAFASPARSLLFGTHTPPPDRYDLQLLMTTIDSPGNARGIFAGISLAPGSDARRQPPEPPARDLDELRRLALRRRNIEQLLQRTEGNEAWAAQVSQMIDGLNDDDTGQLLAQLAEGYRKTGRLDLAADTYFLLARRTPDHPLADHALTWLIQFYSSSEVAHRLTAGSPPNRRSTSTVVTDRDPVSEPNTTPPRPSNPVRQAVALTPLPAGTLSRDDRLRRAAQLADYLKTARPALYAEPAVRFAEVTAQRQLGYANPAKRFFITLRQLPETDPWRQCAATEEWLDSKTSSSERGQGSVAAPGRSSQALPPSKKLAACRLADQPPHLDGRLDEHSWETADRLPLHSSGPPPRSGEGLGEGLSGAEVRVTHDDQFLYIAAHCLKAPNVDYGPDDRPRPRDADLNTHDRVTLKFDTDRDYTTAFEFTIDNRGWMTDACWGDATWNPTWYVASAADDTSWTIEAAIPLSELTDQPPTARDVWAVAACRTIPGNGNQTWSGDSTSNDTPAQFGLLLFE